MKIKLKRFHTKYKIDYWLITITPIVDTINGLFLLKHGATEISIGTVYRLLLLIYVIVKLCKKRALIIQFLPLLYFPVGGIIRGGDNLFGCFTYAAKWLLPLALILYYGFSKKNKNDIKSCLIRAIDFWSVFVPISLIIEYVFKLGQVSYYDAGFKGLYYSTNDIALVLIVCFIYTLWKTLNIDNRNVIWCMLCFISIVILSTKSSLIFAFISLIYMLIASKKIKIYQLISVVLILVVVWGFANSGSQLNDLLDRYSNMWVGTYGNSWINRFLVFATSGRTSRISTYFNEINKHGVFVLNLFLGWITPDNAHVIEMDWHDLLCQYGIIGFLICFFEYGSLLVKCKIKSQPFWYIIMVCLIYSILAGHVISGAFSGTTLALVFSLLLLDTNDIKSKKVNRSMIIAE